MDGEKNTLLVTGQDDCMTICFLMTIWMDDHLFFEGLGTQSHHLSGCLSIIEGSWVVAPNP